MQVFKIPVTWEMYGTVVIEANNLEEAIKIFDETEADIDLPESSYVEDSFRREETDYIKEFQTVLVD